MVTLFHLLTLVLFEKCFLGSLFLEHPEGIVLEEREEENFLHAQSVFPFSLPSRFCGDSGKRSKIDLKGLMVGIDFFA